MKHPDSVDAKVEGERQIHVFDGDLHTRLLRGVRCRLPYQPVLYRWQVDEDGQDHKQQNGTQ